MIIMGSFLAILFIYAAIYADYRLCKHLDKRQSAHSAFLKFKSWFSRAYHHANDQYLRSKTFDLSLSPKPFEDKVMRLHVCKYFKYMECVPVNKDIACFRFTILGISPEYQGAYEQLGEILEQLLQDEYMDRYGRNFYPVVHSTYFAGSRLEFWVARNALGNNEVFRRIIEDACRDEPCIADLEND